jgi:biofilm PGA synthesis lipoprotein PgaB
MFLVRIFFIMLLTMWMTVACIFANTGVIILCYHDIGSIKTDPYMISKNELIEEFNYLKEHGFHPISVQQYIDANEKGATLPDKPVLLSFDDGYLSFYKVVYPLLKKYHYPAMSAVVTFWETEYHPASLGPLMNWDQIRELDKSGLVTIASHSYNVHHLIQVNSFGDLSESDSGFAFAEGKYETLAHYEKRMNDDFAKAQKYFVKELGHKAVALVWPYGEYTMMSVKIAEKNGFKVCFGLGQGYNVVGTRKSLAEADRGLVYNKPTLSQFAHFVEKRGNDDRPMKAAWVKINNLYDPHSALITDENVRFLINRYYSLGINTVFLQAAGDPDKNGNADGVYFYNTQVPVKALAYDHIARKFRAEGIYVYAWLPENAVSHLLGGDPAKMTKLYAQLAQYSFLDGLVLQGGKTRGGLDATETQERKKILTVVHNFKPYAKFVDMLYPELLSPSEKSKFFSQNYAQVLAQYDYILFRPGRIGRKPTMDDAEKLYPFLEQVIKQPGGSSKIIAEVPAFDWRHNRWLLDSELRGYVHTLKGKGIQLFDFYPDAVYNENSGF